MRGDENRVFGLHAVQALMSNPNRCTQHLFLLEGRHDKRFQSIQLLASQHNIPIHWVTREKLDHMVNGNHQGVIAITAKSASVYDEAYLKSNLPKLHDSSARAFILVLDGITDPHNLGACLRSAEAAGVQFVIIPKDNAASLSATAIKVACGAAETLPLIRVTNLARTLSWLQSQGVWLVGAAGQAEQRYDEADFSGALAIVMGAEGKGLRRLTRERCDTLVRIPMMGQVNSLNVSVATGICLFEALRQRTQLDS